ncbi:DUF222 domain-containing protein [Mycobacterium tilburgii]
MFDKLPAEVIAGFDELFERRHPKATPESGTLLEQVSCLSRAENRAAAGQLAAIGALFAYRLSRCAESEEWAVDTEAAVSAEVAAELRISQGLAASRMQYARVLREWLPRVAEVFASGDLDFRMVQTLVYRTDLLTDVDVLAAVDAQLAVSVACWLPLTPARLAAQVDKAVARADADAVRRRRDGAAGREVGSMMGDGVGPPRRSTAQPGRCGPGCAAGRGGSHRLCPGSAHPRAVPRRCIGRVCGRGGSAGMSYAGASIARPAGPAPGASRGHHVIAEQATVAGRGSAPSCQLGAEGLIPPELVAEAKHVPLIHPADVPPEPSYVPFGENVLGLDREATARRHADFDLPGRAAPT